jgi:hypothetical protein
VLIVFVRKIRSMCNVYTNCDNIIYKYYGVILPVALAVSSNACVCDRLFTGVAGSNPAVFMDVS